LINIEINNEYQHQSDSERDILSMSITLFTVITLQGPVYDFSVIFVNIIK